MERRFGSSGLSGPEDSITEALINRVGRGDVCVTTLSGRISQGPAQHMECLSSEAQAIIPIPPFLGGYTGQLCWASLLHLPSELGALFGTGHLVGNACHHQGCSAPNLRLERPELSWFHCPSWTGPLGALQCVCEAIKMSIPFGPGILLLGTAWKKMIKDVHNDVNIVVILWHWWHCHTGIFQNFYNEQKTNFLIKKITQKPTYSQQKEHQFLKKNGTLRCQVEICSTH